MKRLYGKIKKSKNAASKCIRLNTMILKYGITDLKIILMSTQILKYDRVSICHKNNCIHTTGDNAKLIAVGTFFMLCLIGIAALTKSN